MKKLLVVALAMVAIASTGFAQGVVAVEEGNPLTFDATLDFYSAHIWRGLQLNDEAVAQPGATIGYNLGDMGAISAGAWVNYDFSNGHRGDGRADGFSKMEYNLSYTIDIDALSLEAGHIWYVYPNHQGPSWRSTEEVYGSVAYNNDIVVPSLTVYYDYDAVDGFYGAFALTKEMELADNVTACVFSSLGAADDDYTSYYYGEQASFIDFNLGANVTYLINDNFSVGATLVWTSLVDSHIRDNADAVSLSEDMIWGGVNFAASF